MINETNDTIVALATPPGTGAIGVIRLSGTHAFEIVNHLFISKDLLDQQSHTIHLGMLKFEGQTIDEVLVSLFKGPRSYTREDVIEISCHGSQYIIQQIIQALIQGGARLARAGEFTQRAFLNGRFDLAQAEAVADLIASENRTAHQAAMNQMRGGFSKEIKDLRAELIHFASMIELELDFTEEDVEFASRDQLKDLVLKLQHAVRRLVDSFSLGNVIKNGVPTVIAGKPNAGKSTLLNALLNEEKAIVSDIPGTTRDFIEDEIVIDGVHFRFIDTAGLRETTDKVEAIGVERTHAKMKEASVVLYLVDMADDTLVEVNQQINKLENQGIPFLVIGNKLDKAQKDILKQLKSDKRAVLISAKNKDNLEGLRDKLMQTVHLDKISSESTIVTSARHYESLQETDKALEDVLKGISQEVTNDFLAMDIRHALQALGEITGEITTDDLLANIFSKFCIGK